VTAHSNEHRIYLLRHGETEWSNSGRHTGRTEVPLTANGEHLARLAGRMLATLRPSTTPTVLASPRQRARRTAELAGLPGIAAEPLLAEWDYGDYEGLTTSQIREQVPDWTVWTSPCPGGETAQDVTERADAVLARSVNELEHGDVVLVGHGHFSRSLIARWLDLPVTSGVRFALDPAGITVLGHERGVPRLDGSNILPWQDAFHW
jgi:broad specificity phosphatase PhoE